jgi:threonine synthase
LFLKIEGQNPTGSHKDRFHAITVAHARALGSRGIVTSSTGNHGAAAAAYAARAGLPSLICLHPEAPPALASQITGYGATIAVVPGRESELISRVVDIGWYPSTSADPALAGRGNPYGAEGYKEIAFEIVDDFGCPPQVVAVPAASGDTLYGIWRGFKDLHERLGVEMPVLLACQPAGAAALAAWTRVGAPGMIEDPRSLALSARDPLSGRHAAILVQHGDALLVTVEEDQLIDAARRLGGIGIYAEPASALAIAGLEEAWNRGLVACDGASVAIVTSSGLNWTRDLNSVFGVPVLHSSVEDVLEVLGES